MLTLLEIARVHQIDASRLQLFLDRGWISPPIIEARPVFRDIDIARAALINDLANEFGVNDEGIDLVLELLDQLYSLRFAFSNMIEALEAQPRGARRHLLNDARKLDNLTRRGSRSRR